MKTGVIAFCGSKGSGKSTSSSILKDIFQGPVEELALAEHLKVSCSKVFNIEMKYFIDPALKEVELDSYINLDKNNLEAILGEFDVATPDYNALVRPHVGQVFRTPRSLLQYIGTEVLQPVDPLIHVKITMGKKDPNKLSIITDLRFLHEFRFMQTNYDFVPVYVKNGYAETAAMSDTHASERQLLLFKDECRTLDNNSDLGTLTQSIRDIIQKELNS